MVNSSRTTHPGEEACQLVHMMNLIAVAVINDSQIVGHTPSDNLFHGIILLEGFVSSAVWRLSYYWEKKERKKAQKYHINILIIMNPQRTRCSFKIWCLCLL